MSPCNVPVQRARARHCAGFLCHCPMPCLHAVSPCHVPTQCPRAVSLCNVPPVQCPHAASLCSVPLQSPSKLPTPCPHTTSLCTLPLQPPMRPCVIPTWLFLCPQGGVGDPGPEATVSLTAFVVVALHSTRVLLPPDSPEQQLLVCSHPLPMSPCPLLVSSMSPCPLPVSSMPLCPLLVLWASSCIPHVSPVVSPCLSLHGVPTLPCPQVPVLGAIACPHTPAISAMSFMPQCPPSVPRVLMHPHISMFPICPHVPQCPPIPYVSPVSSTSPHVPMSPHVPVSSHPMSVPQDKALSQASTFLRGHVETLGTFGTAITAYALALVDTSPPGPQPAVERLRRLARKAHGEHTAGSPWGHPNT